MNFTKLPFSKQKQIDEGPVRTIDSSSLARPFDPPKPVLIVSLVFALIAAIIGGRYAFGAIDGHTSWAAQAATPPRSKRISTAECRTNLPIMENYDFPRRCYLLCKTFCPDAGYQTLQHAWPKAKEGVDVMKIPSDVTLARCRARLR